MNNQMVLFDVAYKAKQQEDAFVQECLKKYPQTSRFTAAFYHQAWQLGEEVSKANPFRMNTEYEMLGVERSATKREVYNAYRRKARKLHPDVGGTEEAFQQLQDAYHKLLKLAPKA